MSQLQWSEPVHRPEGPRGSGRLRYFRMPDAGEGLTEAEIVRWRVRPGDTVLVNDPVVEVETAKSLVELPCPFAGVVHELLVAEGATVPVGTPIIVVDTTVPTAPAPTDPAPTDPAPTDPAPTAPAPTAPAPAPTAPSPAPGGPAESGPSGGSAPAGRTPVLVGYGPRTTAPARRRRVPPASPGRRASVPVLAKPPVRKLARDLGVDLANVPATGAGGNVTRADVERWAALTAGTGPVAPGPDAGDDPMVAGTAASPVSHRWATGVTRERETRIPIRGVRRRTAEAMVASAFTAPHVTEWLSVDLTRTVRLVDRLREDREFAGVKVSPLLVVARALVLAVRRQPEVNAVWDAAAGEIVVKHYVNLGIAAATPRGLVVPNIKNADRLGLRELAEALAELTATAREGRTPPAALVGGTITITNVGVFGVDAGTPILNPGEAAILALGQVRRLPWVHKGKVRPRWVTQLAVSFDHRLVDGDVGSRLLADVGTVLEDPARALAWS